MCVWKSRRRTRTRLCPFSVEFSACHSLSCHQSSLVAIGIRNLSSFDHHCLLLLMVVVGGLFLSTTSFTPNIVDFAVVVERLFGRTLQRESLSYGNNTNTTVSSQTQPSRVRTSSSLCVLSKLLFGIATSSPSAFSPSS